MKSEEINDWLQVLGLIAVAVSLVFVGLELKQAREIAIADVYQGRAQSAINLLALSSSNEAYVTGIAKLKRGEKLTEYENAQIMGDLWRWLNHFENIHFQHQMGLLPQEQWDAARNELLRMANLKIFLKAWKAAEAGSRASFADTINEIIKESNSDAGQPSK